RYGGTDRLSDIAWQLFERTAPGWARVQAICDFVHHHIAFGYEHARATKTAWDAYNEGKGVCRDYAHLAIAFCRCMNIPARYCTGYLSDIGTPKPWAAGDFAGWVEAYLGGRCDAVDPLHDLPRTGPSLAQLWRAARASPGALGASRRPGLRRQTAWRAWADRVRHEARGGGQMNLGCSRLWQEDHPPSDRELCIRFVSFLRKTFFFVIRFAASAL